MKKTNNKGFSLVELIIVIAIMAVLIGVLAPQFIKYVEKSRESTDLQNIEEIKTAIEAYVADNEGITANITVSFGAASADTSTITYGGITVTNATNDLEEYGISYDLKTKAKWTSSTWTYDKDKYNWKCTTNGHSTYKNADGSDVAKSGNNGGGETKN